MQGNSSFPLMKHRPQLPGLNNLQTDEILGIGMCPPSSKNTEVKIYNVASSKTPSEFDGCIHNAKFGYSDAMFAVVSTTSNTSYVTISFHVARKNLTT